jgi:hypothetical protein
LAVRAAKLAETLYRQDRFDESEHWTGLSRTNAARDDRSAQLILGSVEAKLLARRGAFDDALSLADATVQLAETTDGLNQIAATLLARGEVLHMAEQDAEAAQAIVRAISLYETKGNAVAAREARDRLGLPVTAEQKAR